MKELVGISLIAVVIFLAFIFSREFACWYFKSNEILEKLDELLKKGE
jgi:hypothetical protein